ncbi:MAG: hypothetical protein A3G60_01375 [Candidatus Ryanbacteria bacterium RIFCSPLOWO2_12_FULL_47_9c]|uniref:Methyltransferase domain-containing protein n=2 Tax=Candidatus Ryaniibacteriota TaxID=1817914 RepID=A0A1G2H5P8_9BACT|nr:MAG: hypothetical protein A3J04_03365 [Candidatus Ryanbacteria bacterium RIFCSPLOWO2_02_FULL_47_14]OGZ57812.1 MAG: hypothetical protein A3G60_01375 [Candidatus Ryanbacteria bacterium RIFCSPLOWO2_12_FULL_47_9c]
MKPYRLSHQRKITVERYDTIVYGAGSYDDCMWQWEKKILDREVAHFPRARYLDFGCGTGRVIVHLESRVSESVGVDNSHEMLSCARERVSRSQLIKVDLTHNDTLAGREFDIITAFRVLLNSEPALRDDILRVLAPKLAKDGIFIFNIHGNTFSYRMLMVLWYKLFGRRLNHLSYLGARRMIEQHGMRVVRAYGFGIIPKPLYRYLPKRALFFLDSMFAKIPFFKYISYNIIFVCTRA